jgi:hypothetical protein
MLVLLAQAGYFQLWYADESGFSLTPSVPYGWSKQGEQAGMLSQRSRRLNVFALLSMDNQLVSYPHGSQVNTAFVIECLDEFAKCLTQLSVVVMDNAPMHRSEAFYAKLAEWQDQGLYVFFLPKYSPHLNRIEQVWKHIKHSWLKAEDYLSFDNLKHAVLRILTEFGSTFTLSFDDQPITEELILKFD